jgi:hypothetical protein
MNERINRGRFPPSVLVALVFCLAVGAGGVAAMDQVTFRRDGVNHYVEGRVEVTAQDGGILLLARDGVLWSIPPEELAKHAHDDAPFRPFSAEEMRKTLPAQLPQGFKMHATAHYLIFHNTSPAYAQWCGALFERLYGAFRNYWTRKGFDLREPEFPLVAVVFADKQSYLKFSHGELGDANKSIIGYFSMATNRMTMYDLTESSGRGGRPGSSAQVNQMLAAPAVSITVATIVHEATHQIAFNCGLHTRYSDCPMWFSEGIAVFCETPDLHNAKGWSGIGAVNRPRLAQFQKYLHSRPRDSLRTLLGDDKRFREPNQALDAYAEAWALTYFLLRQHGKQYVEYLQALSAKKPLLEDGPEKRLALFQRCFGDLERLDWEFLRYMARVR